LIIDDLRLTLGREICYCKDEKSYIFFEETWLGERLFHQCEFIFEYSKTNY
jgi:hypothetical protein